MKMIAMTLISMLIFIGSVGPSSLSELLAETTVTGSTVESD